MQTRLVYQYNEKPRSCVKTANCRCQLAVSKPLEKSGVGLRVACSSSARALSPPFSPSPR